MLVMPLLRSLNSTLGEEIRVLGEKSLFCTLLTIYELLGKDCHSQNQFLHLMAKTFSIYQILEGGLFQSLAFPSMIDIKKQHNSLNQLNQRYTKRLFHKRNLVVTNDFFIKITKVSFLSAFLS